MAGQLSIDVINQLRLLLGSQHGLTEPEDLITYAFDGTAAMRQMPGCVALPQTTEQVACVLKLTNETRTPVVTRGSGTGLSGGSLPVGNDVVLCLVKMNHILELDRAILTLLVESGVTTQAVADAAADAGLFYPPIGDWGLARGPIPHAESWQLISER